MAGEWIKMRKCLRNEPEVISISTTLNMDEDMVVGKLHALWSWADDVSRNGHAPMVTDVWIDRYLRVPGFTQALVAVGWIEVTDDGISFPNYDRHMSQNAKTRALNSHRKSMSRVNSLSSFCPDDSVTKARPEKRREEKNIRQEPPLPPEGGDSPEPASEPPPAKREPERLPDLPEDLDTPELRQAVADWIDHRRRLRKKIHANQWPKFIKQLRSLGADAIPAIEASIANGYQGLFPPRAGPAITSSKVKTHNERCLHEGSKRDW